MKAIITLLVLGGLALGAVYMFGGYRDFDPNKQGEEARAQIKPGMTLAQVLKVAGNNPKYQAINKIEQVIDGEKIEEIREGPEVEFREDRIKQHIRDKKVPNGFILTYRFSERTAFRVHFNDRGQVEYLSDAFTMGDLLQTR